MIPIIINVIIWYKPNFFVFDVISEVKLIRTYIFKQQTDFQSIGKV